MKKSKFTAEQEADLKLATQAMSDVWNAIAPDIDTLEGGCPNNKGVLSMCFDYLDMYTDKKYAEACSRLLESVGFDKLVRELDKRIALV